MGVYDTTDYVSGTGDFWNGNTIASDIGGNTGLVTTAVPAAAS
jgi:hypothetical protein